MFDSLNPFTNCTVVSFSAVPLRADVGDLCETNGAHLCETDGADLCEADDGELATARSRTPQLPRRFPRSQDIFLPWCIPAKGEKLQPSPLKLVVRRQEDGGDLCEVDDNDLARARSTQL